MEKQGIYKELAKYYDLIYSWKDYKKESDRVRDIIKKYKKSDGNLLLEVACGTGKHLGYLKKYFSCTGLDLNESMLKLARKRTHRVKFIKGDMINFSFEKKFDVITCLFSSIGYVKNYKNLERTLKNFSRHLNIGGIVIIEPWFTKSTYSVGSPHLTVYQDDNVKIARESVSEAKNGISIMDMHYLIAERNKKVKHFFDIHELGMFETSKTLQLMKKAGFKAEFTKNGLDKQRGLFIGVKKGDEKFMKFVGMLKKDHKKLDELQKLISKEREANYGREFNW